MDSNLIWVILMSFVTPIGVTITISKKDLVKPEPPHLIILGFIMGMISVALVLAVGIYIMIPLVLQLFTEIDWSFIVFEAFVTAALVEEFTKLLLFGIVFWRLKDFDEILDGIVYAVAIGLGFAALENLMVGLESGPTLGFALRQITSVPAHAIAGGIMGYFLGQAKTGDSKIRNIFLALFCSVVFHGVYDVPALGIDTLYIAITLGLMAHFYAYGAIFLILIVGWLIMRSLISRARELDNQRDLGSD